MSASKSVILKGCNFTREEFKAAGAITPGHLCQLGSAGTIVVHATASGNINGVLVALENDVVGNDIADAYASGDQVQTAFLASGTTFNAILKDGQNIVIGDILESAGDGTLQKHVLDSTGIYYHNSVRFIAREAVDMSGSAGVDPSPRIAVTVI